MKAAFHTLGCKVNFYETEAVWELLLARGYDRVEYHERADVFVINTCTVTNNGEAKSRKVIRQATLANPDAIIVVMGCFTQLKGDEVLQIPGVKIVLGTSHRDSIPDYIEEYRKLKTPLNKVASLHQDERYDALSIVDFVAHQRAFLKIQDGCNHFCTYCIIPYARGRVRSKAPQTVLEEARNLVQNGHVEVILTGIHTGGYGEDFPDYDFADLLQDLTHVEGLKRIRISSIEITELTDKVVHVLMSSKLFCDHLHIPLQSGSDAILKRMNRKYTTAEFQAKIAFLRERFANLAVTTDVIVGFPGETDALFDETMAFVETMAFSELHVFPYSKRTGTVAAQMKDEVDGITKKARVAALIALGNDLSKRYIQTNLGTVLEVIPESSQNGMLVGHTTNYIRVKFPGRLDWVGIPKRVVIQEEAYPESLAVLHEPVGE
jgi:threonylcarbamoyladenosine tRNA methylthiotransferase MtaB